MSVEGSVRPRSAFCRCARQRKGRLGKIHDRDAYRGRADEGRPAGRHHRSRLRARRASPITSRTAAPGPSAPGSISNCRRIIASRAATARWSTTTRRPSSAISPQAIDAVEHTHDFVVVDTPGNDSYLMRLAHSMADTLITPLNDSFVDFDVLGTVDPATFAVTGTSHYAEMVREARRQRRVVDHATIDWIVVRNRLSMLGSRNKRLVGEGLQELSLRLGFRCRRRLRRARGLSRVLSARPDRARRSRREHARHAAEHVARHRAAGGRERCSTSLKLPLDERGQRRAAARRNGSPPQAKPLELHDILGLVA